MLNKATQINTFKYNKDYINILSINKWKHKYGMLAYQFCDGHQRKTHMKE